ncbi:ArsR/SmtB family transcription factor [Marinobacter zhejiangensis]|uniref:ArsR family transcriptional regulator n=1 Tax=Marinobacter zhejiangensis TaxID=488535 RepID=A0A1I4RWL6_9GAMM|nr:metalloregulator ArsR/SmtB family transcription factor [Marinobacter zhejiangensis]SFM56571.1 ArsR family transcriptional regulator [Marinobacter zhejiangensis]
MEVEAAIDLKQMQQSAENASQFLRSLANRDRLMLLCHLTEGEACVGDLEALTGIRQPSLSQQLGVLRREGLIEPRKQGKNVYYRIASDNVRAMLAQLYLMFCSQETGNER